MMNLTYTELLDSVIFDNLLDTPKQRVMKYIQAETLALRINHEPIHI